MTQLVLHALSDPNRRQIIAMLRSGERPVGELVRALPIAQSGVSRHLRLLKEAGVVRSRKDGQRRLYSLRPEPFQQLSDWLSDYRVLWEQRLDNLDAEIQRRRSQGEFDE